MAKNQSRRLKPSVLSVDESGFAALQTIPHYAPVNPSFSIDLVTTVRRDMANLRVEEMEAQRAYSEARKAAVAKEWEFHNLMLAVKTQIIAQFGPDSDELTMLGRKKKSDYKPPGRRSNRK